METNNETQKIERQALNVYVLLAALVYASALLYCHFTNRLDAMAIVAGAATVLGILVIRTYRSFNKS